MVRAGVVLALLLSAPAAGLGAGDGLPFAMPVPEGWRTETLPFPLEFAPDLPYTGLEELRFAPGMFEPENDELWSYAFVWWIDRDQPTDPAALATHLESYFRGLARAVGEARGVPTDGARFATQIRGMGGGRFAGAAETFDAFTTRDQIVLRVQGEVRECPAQGRKAVLFELSPQPPEAPVWEQLRSIRRGFRCIAPLAVSSHFDLHSDPDVNLHHFLYQWSRHRDPDSRWDLLEIPEQADLERLNEADARHWQEALDFYRRELAFRHLFFDDEMLELRYLLSEEPREPTTEQGRRLLEALDRVRDIYLATWWPGHDAANRAWAAALLPHLRAHEAEISPRLASAYGGTWPEEPIRVDVTAYSHFYGAYASREVVISSRNSGNAGPHALEVLFHESSHYPSLEQPLRASIGQEFRRQGLEAPSRLWHLFMFFTAGELVRQAYAGAGDDGYRHVGDEGVYARRAPAEVEALSRHWLAYLNGESDRATAMTRVAGSLGAAGATD